MTGKATDIISFRPEHLPRMLEITREGFQGVSIDYLMEEKFGRVDPGWEHRKCADIEQAAHTEPAGIFVAVDGDEVVGYVTVETSEEKMIGRIPDLAVDSRYQRRGLGSRLIDWAMAYIKDRGMRFAKIETLTTNVSGQTTYPKRGFVEVARQIHYVFPLSSSDSEYETVGESKSLNERAEKEK